jgi:glycosyltransferase involved in cell wall biosynthesis
VKAFDIFLRAARLISEKLPDAAFVIAGDGPLMSSLAVLSRDLGIDDRVVLTGFRDDILNLMNTFDIYVISSHHEGIPISALEAMAMKKALVSTRVGGMPEIIEDSHSGLLVEPGNANAIADGCVRILNDPKLRADIENGARSRVEEEFSVAIQRERIVNLYTELMS